MLSLRQNLSHTVLYFKCAQSLSRGGLQAHEAAITCMRYTHNENWLVTSDGIGHIKYWKGRNELVKVSLMPGQL